MKFKRFFLVAWVVGGFTGAACDGFVVDSEVEAESAALVVKDTGARPVGERPGGLVAQPSGPVVGGDLTGNGPSVSESCKASESCGAVCEIPFAGGECSSHGTYVTCSYMTPCGPGNDKLCKITERVDCPE